MRKSIREIFPGIMILDKEPVKVRNPYSGESIMLTPDEVAVYDYLKGCEMIQDWTGVEKGLDWFLENNSKAYMVLLD